MNAFFVSAAGDARTAEDKAEIREGARITEMLWKENRKAQNGECELWSARWRSAQLSPRGHELLKVLMGVEDLIRVRRKASDEWGRLLREKLEGGDITLLNVTRRLKGRISFAKRMSELLAMGFKIHHRGLHFLFRRVRQLLPLIEKEVLGWDEVAASPASAEASGQGAADDLFAAANNPEDPSSAGSDPQNAADALFDAAEPMQEEADIGASEGEEMDPSEDKKEEEGLV